MPLTVEKLRIARDNAADKPIVDGVSFHLEDRSLTLLIGQTGSGKTTLLRAMSGLAELAAGQICYDGDSLWTKPGKVNRDVLLRHAIAFQFPEHQLFASTIGKEFAYSLKPYRLKRVERVRRSEDAMREMNLARLSPEGSPFALSGGQKRRVAIATSLSAHTPWLLLDEPSAGLDGPALRQLKERLLAWKQSRGIVMATHDWETFLPIADRVLLIAEGKLLADLQPESLLQQPELLQQAGVGVPASLQMVHAMQQTGLSIASKLYSPDEIADAIASAVHAHSHSPHSESAACLEQPLHQEECPRESQKLHSPCTEAAAVESSVRQSEGQPLKRRWIYRQRAGSKWLLYTGLSIVILLLQGWWGTGIALLLAFGSFLFLTKKDAVQGIRLSRPLFYFILIAGTISGLRLSTGEWTSILDVEEALLTIRRMTRFLAITLIGFVFTLSTSTAEMKRGLERALAWGRRFLPVDMISLAAALILRFIPLIVDEAQRFSVITAARGKKLVKQGKIRMRDIHVFVIPLLLSLFQMVEDLITAMEIKGYKHMQKGEGE